MSRAPFASAAVVGASGQMGGLFCRELAARGVAVHPLSRPYSDADLARALGRADLALVSVPVTALEAVLAQVVPHLAPGALLMDVCSVKVQPMRQMLAAYAGPVIGTHPLFGPVIPEGFTPRTVVTPGPGADPAPLLALLDAMGHHPFLTTPEEHDRAMAFVQGLNFVTSVAFMAALRDVPHIERYVTPSLARRVEAARKMLTQDSELFAAVSEANPYTQETIRQFRSYLSIAAGGDLELLADHAGWWWRNDPREGASGGGRS
ncbi:MAG: prephenate dehydrogenase/arogenate dehydrogenase family protein [Desulfovibrionaceae bacterium]